ncbi:ABC-type Mn2+/Zn2+ transport system, permease component [Candidatus Methanoperedens nitroreducens]|uniref:ABC-type Mn2+/Zn2+ transport system, permease component n=1 Tax=Candidatus Methanoperedens nitratireducens TaxID=1392998 RepID=A0A062V771_9EURY|nr:metal ABC transporter permease [Candidatus Methanoperedens nitroreducens]KCZ73162.1 ABC-type Mn2+/Zn2+ transport system, permease component [Candidatus Methanoperedens nitroreducens]MDJ1422889.1 metal ABC transporter permease [Candidatus Methanoperedens sp.]
MLEAFQYGFMQRALVAGIMIAIICSAIGTFIVLKRLSMIGDGLAHISLGGIALGLFFGVYPVVSALIFSVLSALGINYLRRARIYGDLAIAIFFSAGLAVAVVILSLARGFNVDLFSYLFGSILTVNETDLTIILGLGILTLGTVYIFYKELFYITFDETTARASGIPVEKLNTLLIVLTAVTVVISLKIVGVLLVSSLLAVPVATSLQISRSFRGTMLSSMIFAIFSVVLGLIISFYFNLAPGGAIVLTSITLLLITIIYKNFKFRS